MRKQYELSKPIYEKRAAAAARIPNFWPLVLEQAPPEFDPYIQPNDNRIINESLSSITVTRPGLDGGLHGNPRDLCIRFEFKPNDDFEDTVLEKHIWHRRPKAGLSALVSEPVKIHWKKGKDLTGGLTDMSLALFEARKKVGDMQAKGVPEYNALRNKLENSSTANTSFFTWFGWISSNRYVSAEESEEANIEHERQKELRRNGETEGLQEDGVEDGEEEEVDVHPAGEDITIIIAEDLWPNASKFFTSAMELGEPSEDDFEDDDGEEDEDDDDQPVDIRSLVQQKDGKSRKEQNDGPPSKRAKK